MAISVQVFDHRNFGIAADALNQAFTTAGNNHIDILRHSDEFAHHRAIGDVDQLHRVLWKSTAAQGLLHQGGQGFIGFNRLRATAQDTCVSALDRQTGRLDRDIGPAFKHHGKYTQWHPHLAHANSTGLLAQTCHLANDFWHRSELLTAQGAGFYNLGAEFEAVHHGG